MLVGKRRQPSLMKRTTSISSGMAVDTHVITEKEVHDHAIKEPHPDHGSVAQSIEIFGAKRYEYGERLLGMAMNPPPISTTTTTINHNQNQTSISSAHVIDTAHFLRTCGLCKRRLAHGRDIYMYRGDTAFCSLECREQQIKQDKRKDKWKLVTNKEDHRAAASPPTDSAKASTKSETIAAAACT